MLSQQRRDVAATRKLPTCVPKKSRLELEQDATTIIMWMEEENNELMVDNVTCGLSFLANADAYACPQHYENVVLASLKRILSSTSTDKQSKRIASNGLLPLASTLPYTELWAHQLLTKCVAMISTTAITTTTDTTTTDMLNTIGLEVLLPSYLARIHATELIWKQQPKKQKKQCHSLEELLKVVCCVDSTKHAIRTTAAAALASSLKEFHSILPNRLVHLNSFIDALLHCLQAVSQNEGDLESIPPVVYQLCLLVTKSGTPDKVLEGIASLFPQLFFSSTNSRKDDALVWVLQTCLAHISRIVRIDSLLPKIVLKFLKRPTAATTQPFRYQTTTPFTLAMGLTMAHSIPRMRTCALTCIRDFVLEEEFIRQKQRTSDWFHQCASTLNTTTTTTTTTDSEELSSSSHMLNCMMQLISILDSTSSDSLALLQSLVSLGFLLVDALKKDNPMTTTTVEYGIEDCTVTELEPLQSFCTKQAQRNSLSSGLQKAQANTSKIGLRLLCHLFLRDSSEDATTSSQLRRSILLKASEQFCGMAPNAVQHSYLLQYITATEDGIRILGSETQLPLLMEFVSHLSGGGGSGIPFAVAIGSIVPTVGLILRFKQKQINDPMDHLFLCAKKALFCPNIEARITAVHIFTMLLSLVIRHCPSLVDEIKGCLRRCLTQHQAEVRVEVYASIVQLMKSNNDGDATVFATILLDHMKRYIAVEETAADLEARRRRAIAHGSQLSQCMDDENDDSSSTQGPPIRLELCIASGSLPSLKSKTFQKQKKLYPTVLLEAIKRFTEPLPFLLSSGKVISEHNHNDTDSIMTDKETDVEALHQMLVNLRGKVACSQIEDYIHWCNDENRNVSVTLSCCLLVASVCESLMDIPTLQCEVFNELEFELIEKLFNLRTEATSKAADILSIQLSTKKVQKNKSTMKTNLNIEGQDEQKNSISKPSMHKRHQQNLIKAKQYIEDAISRMCPTLSPSFLATCLRSCIALDQSKGIPQSSQELGDDDHSRTQSVHERMSNNSYFRSFLFAKIQDLLSGRALVVKRGLRFDKTRLLRNDDASEKEIGLFYISCSMQLGPLLLAEFVQQRKKTTVVDDPTKIPFSQAALRSYILCIRRVASDVKGHGLETIKRLSNFLHCSFQKLYRQIPEVKPRWISLLSRTDELGDATPDTEGNFELARNMLPFILPMKLWDSEGPSDRINGGLLSELVRHGLDGEAADCCNLLTCLMCHLTSKMRKKLCLFILQCFENVSPECSVEGILGLRHDDSSNNGSCQISAASAIDSIIFLDGLFDDSTPTLSECSSEHDYLSQCLSFTDHRGPSQERKSKVGTTEFFELDGDKAFGVSYRLAISFLAATGIGHNFEDSFKTEHISTINGLNLACTQIVSSSHGSSGSTISKELTSAADSLLSVIDVGLSDAEFIITKLISSTASNNLLLLQKMLAGRLYAVTKIICTLVPCAENLDDNGRIMAFLLKSCSRHYNFVTRYVLCHSLRPQSLICPESKQLLDCISAKFAPRTLDLLLTMQEMSKAGDGKMLANTKIESQGKVAAQVVFEQEKFDNALLTMSEKLKTDGLLLDGKWIEKKVADFGKESTTLDFRIKKDHLQVAKENRRGKKYSKNSKRSADETKVTRRTKQSKKKG